MNGSTLWKKYLLPRLALLTIPIAILAGVNGCGTAKTFQESVIVRDTVIVTKERKLIDTVMLQNWDTITMTKDRVSVRLIRVNDTIFVDAKCPTDTFIVNTVTINNVKEQKSGRGYEFYLGWIIVILCFFVLFKTILNKVI
jgi:hypothetical protein